MYRNVTANVIPLLISVELKGASLFTTVGSGSGNVFTFQDPNVINKKHKCQKSDSKGADKGISFILKCLPLTVGKKNLWQLCTKCVQAGIFSHFAFPGCFMMCIQ